MIMDTEALIPGNSSPTVDQAPVSSGTAGLQAPAGPETPAPKADVASPAEPEKNLVFSGLVRGDGDIAGLVAYSIYKQNKLDWLQAFETAKSRVPGEAEISAYIIGESTSRRLATYRHLAEATLAGNGPELDGSGMKPKWDKTAGKGGLRGVLLAVLSVVAILALAALWLVTHYTLTVR
jgi:hypothetical protein